MGVLVENGTRPDSAISWKDMFDSASSFNTRPGLDPSSIAPASHFKDSTLPGSAEVIDNVSEMEGVTDQEGSFMQNRQAIGCGNPSAAKYATPNKLHEANFQLAIYVAMAHAGLALVVVVLYGVGRLLKDFWKPIQWAVLCSMPLREVQEAMVTFWKEPLRLGLVESLVAPPVAVYKALLGTLLDARDVFSRFIRRRKDLGPARPVGFAKLFQWLVSFAFLTLGLDVLGPANLCLVALVGVVMHATGTGVEVAQLTSALSHNGRLNSKEGKLKWVSWLIAPITRASKAANQRISRSVMGSLHTLVAVGLIITMILGSLGGLALFSYKVGMEGKDAVVMIKVHLEENDYAEVVGYNKWIENSKVPELLDSYVAKGYDAVVEQVDVFAAKNNLTEFVEVGKEFLRGLIQGDKKGRLNRTVKGHPLLQKLHGLQGKVREFDFQGIVQEIEGTFIFFLEHFHMKREDFLEKAKQVAQRSTDIGRKVLSSGTNMVQSGASLFIFLSSSIASGAAELFNFITQTVVFFSVLYYLITSKTGGVMEQILEMVPLSEPTRRSCANVLDHAVSSVLLAAVKTAFFQASFTWLLFRFCDIHFLYGCTLIALVQAFLPLFPNWIATVPLVVELALERQYIAAVVLMIVHIWVMDYGIEIIHEEIPGHNAYLTGLSIAGGMALFTPALEGAIMGPLLMTVLIASKNLYSEFVLSAEKEV